MVALRVRLGRSRRSDARAWPSATLVEVAARHSHVTHYVSDVEMGALAQGRTPVALCGQPVVPAGLTVAPGPLCRLCAALQLRDPR